ncbi:hypothetical protein M2305_002699 [Gluconobacter cerinus]|uniref:hypothetical protein n=1 Tax=Gluconobacter cerinus TaxID=38307 RepID=UPI00222795D1|nr:hypothetical protein [Gluconobacter cerinus]MCW2266752.1 hypothetical protein [Gluconobacter cerinus]
MVFLSKRVAKEKLHASYSKIQSLNFVKMGNRKNCVIQLFKTLENWSGAPLLQRENGDVAVVLSKLFLAEDLRQNIYIYMGCLKVSAASKTLLRRLQMGRLVSMNSSYALLR